MYDDDVSGLLRPADMPRRVTRRNVAGRNVSDSAITYSTPIPCGTAELRLRPQWFACLSSDRRRASRDAGIGAPSFGGSCGLMCDEARSAGAQPAAHLSGHFGGDLVGDVQRRVRGVGAASVAVDNDVVFYCQRPSTAPAGGIGVQLSCGGAQCAVGVGYRPHGPFRIGLGVGVLAAGRPLLSGDGKEGAGLFGGREEHHRLLDIMSEVIALLECLIA